MNIKLFQRDLSKESFYIISAMVDPKTCMAVAKDKTEYNLFYFSEVLNDELLQFVSIEEAQKFLEKNSKSIMNSTVYKPSNFKIDEINVECNIRSVKVFESIDLTMISNIISKLSPEEIEFFKKLNALTQS